MNKIELLAPAGDMERLYAAVQAGADAVYMGGSKFSARAYAGNFDEENMVKAVQYCHLYGVKVYITVNTLIKENEMKEALEYVKFLYRIGVDAIIIQDLGLTYRVMEELPSFELHASTQMTIHNGEGAILLRNAGIKRIVLSRELSLEEIKYISKDLNIDTEIFIHGALCICYSGQCLMSSMIGGRSGNRGRCAQPCRLPYTLINKNSGEEKKGYLISPKDICTLGNIKEIIESCTSSLKIEGRMKRPEYVAGVIESYRKGIDLITEHRGQRIEDRAWKFDFERENKKLLQLFNREGFSKAYLFGNKGRDMMAYNFPKNTGIVLGKVNNDLTISLKESIRIGDGIRNGDNGFTVTSIIKDEKEVEEAFCGDKIKFKPSNYSKGNILFKTSDEVLNAELQKYYKNPFDKKINLPLSVKFKIFEAIELKSIYKGKEFTAYGDVIQKALKKPLEGDKIIENLGKSGETPFKFENIRFEYFEEGFLPVSAINKVRRDLIEQIEKYVLNTTPLGDDLNTRINNGACMNKMDDEKLIECSSKGLGCFILVNSNDQLKAAMNSSIENIIINIYDKRSDIDFNKFKLSHNKKNDNIILNVGGNKNIFLKIPNIIKSEFNDLVLDIEKNLPYIKGIVTGNLGIINIFAGRTVIVGDYKLNIYNSDTIKFYKNMINVVNLSVELNKKELEETIKNINIPFINLIYGKIELMVSEYCAIGSVFGGKCSEKSCDGACTRGNYVLKDRLGEEFVTKTDKFCRSYIYNNVPLNLIPNLGEFKRIGAENFRLDFIDENYEETSRVLKAFEEKKWNGELKDYTRGHFKRGVE